MSTLMASTRELIERLQSGETAVSLTQSFLDAITKGDASIHAFVRATADGALAAAASVDARRQAGESLSPIAGLPIALKDNICTRGVATTCSSRMLENFIPPYDAHVVTRLREAGAIIIGKTNLDEFAMGSSTENSAIGPTRNPWNTAHAPGGSSGGSAAAVAAQFAPLALGSDTGGSIRQPASFCGVVGLKPTYGRVSRYGLVAYASSLDQIGPFARDVEGAALLFDVIAGHDERDSTSVNRPVPKCWDTVNQPLTGLRVGVAKEHFGAGLDTEVEAATRKAIDVYRSLGATIVDLSLPHSKYAIAVYYLIACSEASSNLARYDGVHYGHRAEKFSNMIDMYKASRAEGFGAEVKRRIMLGTYALSSGYYDAYYLKALKVRRLIRNDFDAAFEKVDVILSPTSPMPAFKVGEMSDDPLKMYLADIYTISANLAGLPGISVPAGMSSSGLPIGLQLLAAPFEEERLLRAARMFEGATDWSRRSPELNH